MHELVKADGIVCINCAARTRSSEGDICVPWKFGPKNRINKRIKNYKLGIGTGSGTSMRPKDCPHPENTVASTSDAQVMLRNLLKK